MRKKCLLWMVPILFIIGCGQQEKTIENTSLKETESEWQAEIKEETILIPGLSKEYSYLYLTDAHVVVPDTSDSEQITEYANQRLMEFTFADTYTSQQQFTSWMNSLDNLKVDGLLLGGDIIDYPSEGNLKYLKEELGQIGVPYLYNLGNHDWTFPWEYMTENGKETYIPLLSDLMNHSSAIHSIETEEFIITAVDNSSNQINTDALEAYKQILQKGKPVILMLHVPLLTQSVLTKAKQIWPSGVVLGGGNYGGIYPDEVSTEFIELTTQDNSPVIAVLAGHVHFYDKDMIDDNLVQIVGGAAYEGKGILLRLKKE